MSWRLARSEVARGRILAALLGLSLAAMPVLAELTPAEVRMAESIESRSPEARALLSKLVEINSGTLNFAGVRRVAEVLEPEFRELGFATEWLPGESFDRAGHLVAQREGSGPHVLLIGHLDTVFEADSPFQTLETLDGDRVRGPGTIDMKGGVVVLLEALRALREIDRLEDFRLTVVLTGDEESSGRPLELSRAALLDAGRAADYALGFEDGDGDPATAVIARRGSARWELTIEGTPAHSSQIFTEQVGAGAIHEAARILEGFRSELLDEKDLTYNPGLIVGGTEISYDPATATVEGFGKNNVVAEFAKVTGDLRTLSPDQLARARRTMEEVAGRNLPGTQAEFSLHEGYPPMAPTAGNRELLALYSTASQDLGLGPVAPVDPRKAGAADISFVAAEVGWALDGLGLMGTGGHTVDETADLETLTSQAQRAALLINRLPE